MNYRKRIVVLGGGFAGVNFIKKFSKNTQHEVVLIDQNNYHFFPPLLYQVSTAFIEASNISYPFRRMFQGKENLKFHLGKFQHINPAEKVVVTDTGEVSYDYVIFAMGTKTNYFGMENIKNKSLPMKTIDDALVMRNQILLNMEKAVQATTLVEKEKHLNIVIAGGGPTGVEVAGMLAEMGLKLAKKEYPEVQDLRTNLYLVDAMPVLLQPMSKKSQDEAYSVLSKLGVHVVLNTAVKDYDKGKVIFSDGSEIETEILIWASGVVSQDVPGIPEESFGRGKRILVDQYNKVIGTDCIFAIGDIALEMSDSNFPNGHPQLAQVAIQQGSLLAKNLELIINNSTPKTAFKYNDKGSMAIISKYKAVVDLNKNTFLKGFFAWIIWLFIHIIPLIGFRNKVKLMSNWLWSFITNDPTLRLIIRPGEKV